MTLLLPPALANQRRSNHPGGLSSIGMVENDKRVPGEPPGNWSSMSQKEKDEYAKEHMTPEEWHKARDNVRKAIMTISFYFPFFGMILTQMVQKQVWIGTEEQLEKMKRGPGDDFKTMATDGRVLYIWPQFALYCTLFELMGILMHELFHNILLHPDRSVGYDPILRNIAMDFTVNLMVNDCALHIAGMDPKNTKMDPSLYDKLPWVIDGQPQIVDPSDRSKDIKWCLDEKYRGQNGDALPWEEIYYLLQEDRRKKMAGQPQAGQGEEGDGDEQGQGYGSLGRLLDGHQVWSPGNRPADEDGETNGKEFDPSDVKSWILDANAVVSQETIGSLPAGLRRRFDEWLNPPLPWNRLLSMYMKMTPYDFGWNPGDLRFEEPMPFIVEEPQLQYITLGFDLSGSMNDFDIGGCIENAKALIRGFPGMKGRAYFWDHVVHDRCDLDDFDGMINREGIHGGGGTSIKPQFDAIEEENLTDKVAVHVCFTDGYVHWQEVDPDTLPYDVIWVIVNDTETPPEHQRYRYTRFDPVKNRRQ